jgi:hypothetical protein
MSTSVGGRIKRWCCCKVSQANASALEGLGGHGDCPWCNGMIPVRYNQNCALMVAASVDSSTHHGGFRPVGGYLCVGYGEGSGCVHEEYLSVCRDTEEMLLLVLWVAQRQCHCRLFSVSCTPVFNSSNRSVLPRSDSNFPSDVTNTPTSPCKSVP